jgi:hypothetical protein
MPRGMRTPIFCHALGPILKLHASKTAEPNLPAKPPTPSNLLADRRTLCRTFPRNALTELSCGAPSPNFQQNSGKRTSTSGGEPAKCRTIRPNQQC